VARDEVEGELNRFRRSLSASRTQIEDLKLRLSDQVAPNDARILDTHLAYLKDSVFIADVEELIIGEQMRLDAAIAKVIADFDRIFQLVESETLRQSAVDLRDVGIRVLRNLEDGEPEAETGTPERYVLVARELSIVDMFDLNNEHVLGIVTEGGGLTSHAAIFARSMRIPTITGVEGLLERVPEGAFLIVDAAEGHVRVNPGPLARAQYTLTEDSVGKPVLAGAPVEEPALERVPLPVLTTDGVELHVSAIAGNLAEVDRSASVGLPGLGLYRTELLYLLDKEPPTREALVNHYRAVAEKAGPGPVCMRLLSANSGLGLRYLYPEREANPHLGRVGIRILLHKEAVLRRQLQALLLAFHDRELRIALPFVTDCGELRRVKEILFEERLELRKTGAPLAERPQVGIVVQTPASVFGIADLARESDFLTINLDSLLQGLLAADRDTGELAEYFESMHPYVLRMLRDVVQTAAEHGRPLSIFGVSAADSANLPLLFGIGLRHFLVPSRAVRAFAVEARGLDSVAATRAARVAAQSSCLGEAQSAIGAYRHGYARPQE
jgi:phosphotransferase system enzyme I (PtsI)